MRWFYRFDLDFSDTTSSYNSSDKAAGTDIQASQAKRECDLESH